MATGPKSARHDPDEPAGWTVPAPDTVVLPRAVGAPDGYWRARASAHKLQVVTNKALVVSSQVSTRSQIQESQRLAKSTRWP